MQPHRIERLMRIHGQKARPRRRELPKDIGKRSANANNVLDRQFTGDSPNQKRAADFTPSGPPKAGSTSRP